jgi:hypothetical protein
LINLSTECVSIQLTPRKGVLTVKKIPMKNDQKLTDKEKVIAN